jgi:hypothetical protein
MTCEIRGIPAMIDRHLQGDGAVMDPHDLTDEQAHWLARVLQTRPKRGLLEQFTVPFDVQNALVEKGFLKWRRSALEITLEGIRAVARRQLAT